MHQQSLMLLHPMVKEKMHLQENTLFSSFFYSSLSAANPVQYKQGYLYAARWDGEFSHNPRLQNAGSRSEA